MKVTVCSLARELRLSAKRIIVEARGEGLYAARSTDIIPPGIARRIRAKYRKPRASVNLTDPIGPSNNLGIAKVSGVTRFDRPTSHHNLERPDFDAHYGASEDIIKSDGLTTDEIEFLLSILSRRRQKPQAKAHAKALA
jgi:hypothetical protein